MNTFFEGMATGSALAEKPQMRQIEWLTEHLPDPQDQREYVREKAAAAISSTIERAMEAANLNRTALAAKLGWEKSQVTRALRGTHNMTIYTLGDLLWACNLELENFDSAVTPLGVVRVSANDEGQWIKRKREVRHSARQRIE